MNGIILFLIPARGGSKGFPGKNLALLGGIPLVGRAVRTARAAAGHFPGSRVVCSTDDARIAEAAREWGAEVPFLRPAELATDTATSMDVVLHALDQAGAGIETVVLIQPTSPLTDPEDVVQAINLLQECGAPIVSIVEVEHPLEWNYSILKDGTLKQVLDGEPVFRRQTARKVVRLNGAIYAAGAAWLRKYRSFIGPRTLGLLMPIERSIDIDSPLDLDIASAIISAKSIKPISIGHRLIGPGHPCFVIAEAGVNHNGSLDMALRLVDAAAEAGADAVKFQLYRSEEQVSRVAATAAYQFERTGKKDMAAMARSYELKWEAHRLIREHCLKRNIIYLSSCFDNKAVDFYVKELLGNAIKVGSGEITNYPLLSYMAATGLPILLSTGMSSLLEVARGVDCIRKGGNSPIILFHCVSCYPTEPSILNLKAMKILRKAFNVPVGFSDHTSGITAAITAIALGAVIIEKHFTLDKSLPGPDHAMSLEPGSLREYINAIRESEIALGAEEKKAQLSELDILQMARRSLVSARKITKGEIITPKDVLLKRPATGIPPNEWELAMGREARIDIEADVPITWSMLK